MEHAIDFYNLKEKIKKEIVSRLEFLNFKESALEGSILLYSLYLEDFNGGIYFKNHISQLINWANNEDVGSSGKHLASLSILTSLCGDVELKSKYLNKCRKIVTSCLSNKEDKFNILNSAEHFFFLSLIGTLLGEEVLTKLQNLAKDNIEGNLKRKILYSYSLRNLGISNELDFNHYGNSLGIQEIVSLLWLFENEEKRPIQKIDDLWKSAGEILPYIEHDSQPESYKMSEMDLFMLFNSVIKECKDPNPLILFGIYPFKKEIKDSALKHFQDRSYPSAVFEVVKKLNKFIQTLSGINKNEDELITETMLPKNKDFSKIIIQFNENLSEDSGKNEQTGLASYAKGIFKAFRNPFGHEPEDHPLIRRDNPFEAISQLISIDYLWKRIESAKIKK